MNVKKVLSILVICAMILSGMTSMAFAEDSITAEPYPNFLGDVWTSNYDCEKKADLEVSIKISKEGMNDIVVPLPYDADLEEYYLETVVEGIDDIVREVGPVYASALMDEDETNDDALPIMESLGYSVEVIAEDNDPDHEVFLDLATVEVEFVTYETTKMILDLITEMIEEAILEYDPTYVPTGSFDALLEVYKEMLLDPEGADMTEEEVQEALAEIEAYETMMNALESGEYAGEMLVYADVPCNCPELVEYTLYHEYYDENGEYVAQETEFPVTVNGTVVDVDDLQYVTDYEGVKYEVEGVYLVDNETGDVDWESPVDEFTVIDLYDEETDTYYWTEVVIKYTPVSDDAGGDEGDIEGDQGDNKPTDKGESTVPPTGDDTSLGFFALLMAAALVGLKKIKA